MTSSRPTIGVFAPVLSLIVTVEKANGDGRDEIHFHPGGQGFWMARMLVRLGERPVLCAPVGGEPGHILRELVPSWGIDLAAVSIDGGDSPSHIEDRRGGELVTIAERTMPMLDRHELDEMYGVVLEQAARTGIGVLSGLPEGSGWPPEIYRRLVADVTQAGARVVGDLHGESLSHALAGGPLDILKVSDEDLRADGVLSSADETAGLAALSFLQSRGARNIVLSRGSEPVLARFGEETFRATTPSLATVEVRGSGDAMTAGLATALGRGYGPEQALRLTCAAGAANVTRHGLGSASGSLVDGLVPLIEVERLDGVTA